MQPHPTLAITSITPGEYAHLEEQPVIRYDFAMSRFGNCFVAAAPAGICALEFCDGSESDRIARLQKEWPRSPLLADHALAAPLMEQLFNRGLGAEPIPLWLKGTPFQLSVWACLSRVPFGTVIAYSELARRAAHPTAVRAVASAVARNPVSYLIPCHRIVRSSGQLGQYRWGAARKATLIGWEKE